MGTDVQFALVPKSLVNLSMADNLDVSDALRPVLTERRRSDTKEAQRIVDAVKAVAVGGTVGDLRRLSDGEWRSLEGVPAMCRILLKYAVRQSTRTGNPPAPPVSSPPAAAAPVESFLDILANEFNYGLPFDMSLYTSNLTALSTMGFKRDEAMEALVLTENKSVDLALEVLLSDATRRKRKREESAARLGRQKPAGSVAASPSSGSGAASAATSEELVALRRQLESERKEKLKAQDDMKGHLGSADRIAYREYMRGMIADQTVTVLSLQHLKTYRDSKNITPADHEAVLKELGLTEEGFEKMKKFQSRAKGDGDCVVCLDKPKDHVIFNCVSGDTLVSLANGLSIRIQDMKDNELPVLSYDKELKGIVPAKQTAWFDQGVRECIQLTFNDGRTLVCTPDHRIRTTEGDVKAEDLVINKSQVICGGDEPVFSQPSDGDLAKVLPTWTLHVVDSRAVGKKQVYDISVPEHELFIANGIVVHNCMHLCLCEDCVAVLSKRGSKCPMCSKRITKIMKVFV